MDGALPIAFRALHLISVIFLLGGVCYARFVVGDLDRRFKPLAYVAIGGILVSGLYNYLSKSSIPSNYPLWFGIKVLLALHIAAVVVLYRGKRRSLTGAAISGAVIVLISGY